MLEVSGLFLFEQNPCSYKGFTLNRLKISMSLADRNRMTIIRFYKALQDGDGKTMLSFYDKDVEQIEWPNQLKPEGGRRNLAQMAADFARSQGTLLSQAYDLKSLVCSDEHVAVEAVWEGVLAISIGRLQVGDRMKAHICNLFTLRNDKIISQRNYDCFEAFN